VKSLSH